jgi:hypothetical protein
MIQQPRYLCPLAIALGIGTSPLGIYLEPQQLAISPSPRAKPTSHVFPPICCVADQFPALPHSCESPLPDFDSASPDARSPDAADRGILARFRHGSRTRTSAAAPARRGMTTSAAAPARRGTRSSSQPMLASAALSTSWSWEPPSRRHCRPPTALRCYRTLPQPRHCAGRGAPLADACLCHLEHELESFSRVVAGLPPSPRSMRCRR